jgi:hypothetical protein
MSTHVTGFIPATDSLYIKHSNVLKACIDAGIEELPRETAEYFNCKYPEKYLFEDKLRVDIPVNEIHNDSGVHYEVSICNIPQGVEKIRFTNSW